MQRDPRNPIQRPDGIPAKVWRNWRRCVRRGHRSSSLEDCLGYAATFGSKPQHNKPQHRISKMIEKALKETPIADTVETIGRKEFNAWKARIEAGRSDPRFRVEGDSIVFYPKRKGGA